MKIKPPPQASSLRDECITLITPAFYKNFQCIGAECENNCCHNWHITMDNDTYQALSCLGDIKVKQIMTEQTRPIEDSPNAERQFVMTEQGNCPCLQQDGWCYLHKNHGEEVLPQICRIYPRDDKLIKGSLFNSLSISCPEAARKILLDPGAMNIEQQAIDEDTDLPSFAKKILIADGELQEQFKQVAYQCLVGSQDDSLELRLFKLAALFDVASTRLDSGEPLMPLLYRFELSLQQKEIDKMYDSTPVAHQMQQFVLQQLLYEKRYIQANEVFLQYRQQAVNKIRQSPLYDSQTESAKLDGFFEQLCQGGYETLIDSHGHVFINLMLHWIYTQAFNLKDGDQLYRHFANLVLKYFYVRTLCSMLATGEAQQDGAMMVGVIHSISRRADHDRQLLSEIYDKLCSEDLGQHSHILGLIKV